MKEQITRYKTKVSRDALPFGGFRAVFLSDLHNKIWGGDIKRLVSKIEEEEPSIVLCGGDMLVAHPKSGSDNLNKAAAFIKELSKNFRIYYAIGNHEYRLRLYPEKYGNMYRDYMTELKNSDVVFLDNKSVNAQPNNMPVRVYGLSIEKRFYHRFEKNDLTAAHIREKIGEPQKDKVNILLAHNPRYLGAYFNWGSDIILCGHYHGGVVGLSRNKGLISPEPSIFPHMAHGCIEINKKTAVISAGMGEHTIPVRINNPREIVVLDVEVW